jgi:hypothetical protein
MHWPAPFLARADYNERRGAHVWFAWYPVRIGIRWYWLENTLRKITYAEGWKIVDRLPAPPAERREPLR